VASQMITPLARTHDVDPNASAMRPRWRRPVRGTPREGPIRPSSSVRCAVAPAAPPWPPESYGGHSSAIPARACVRLRLCRASLSPPIRAERSITPSVSRWRCKNRTCGGSCVMPKPCCLGRAGRAGAAVGSSVEPQTLPASLNWAPQPDSTTSP
jgi:hypothetical protein